MKLCVVSSKQCWQDESGRWVASGCFPGRAAALTSLFDETTLVVSRSKKQKWGAALPAGACVLPLKNPPGLVPWRKLGFFAHLPDDLRLIRQEVARADVIYAEAPGSFALLAVWLALSLKKRLIVRYAGSWSCSPHTSLMDDATRLLMRRLMKGNHVMLATGDGAALPDPGVHWIFDSAIAQSEVDEVQPVLDRGLSTPARLAYIGRLAPEKGLDVLIKAVGLLKKRGVAPLPAVELIGEGPLQRQLQALAEQQGVSSEFIFVGRLSRPTLMEYLKVVDVCVLPSLSGPGCQARLDAMLCGLPVITTEVGFGRESIGADGERGWLAESGSVTSLAEAIHAALTQPVDWSAIRRRCRRYVEAYTLEAWARRIGAICAQQWNGSLEGGKLCA